MAKWVSYFGFFFFKICHQFDGVEITNIISSCFDVKCPQSIIQVIKKKNQLCENLKLKILNRMKWKWLRGEEQRRTTLMIIAKRHPQESDCVLCLLLTFHLVKKFDMLRSTFDVELLSLQYFPKPSWKLK